MENIILEIQNLSKHFGSNSIVTDANLTIQTGKSYYLYGESGTGKTTLFRILAHLEMPDSGRLLWHGSELHSDQIPEFRRKTQYITNEPIFWNDTVKQILQSPFSFQSNRSQSFSAELAEALVLRFGRKSGFLDKKTSGLSAGEKQIVNLTRSLLLEPEFMLLDEPTANLDEETSEKVLGFLSEWIRQKPSIRSWICISHNPAHRKRESSVWFHLKDSKLEVQLYDKSL